MKYKHQIANQKVRICTMELNKLTHQTSTGVTLLEVALCKSRILNNDEKYMLITTAQFDDLDGDFDRRFFIIECGMKTKRIQFQKRWLKEYDWLRYGNSDGNKGGWSMLVHYF